MSTSTTEPRIYVACLASYNNGVLHGAWIDATTDVDAMGEEIAAILRASPYPNVRRQDYRDAEGDMHHVDVSSGAPDVPEGWTAVGATYDSAEEWAIHDSEGLGDLGEYAGLQEVARRVEIVEVAEDRDIPASVLIEAMSDADADDAESFVDDQYDGTASSWESFCEDRFTETGGMEGVPDSVAPYIDFERMGRDWELSGDWSAYRAGELYFFRNH